MINHKTAGLFTGVGVAVALTAGMAAADSIDPATFSAALEVGDSVTISKTVTVDAGKPSDALIDVHFLFDTSGSMGSEIRAAQAAASDIFTSLATFGDVAAGVGVYSEAARLAPAGAVPGRVINQDLTTDIATATTALNGVTLSNPDGGGDGPENGNTAIDLVSKNLSWRPGSSRFIVAFGDFRFKSSNAADSASHGIDAFDNVDNAPISSNAATIAAMTDFGVDLVGVSFGGSFAQSVDALGGTSFASSATTESIVESITSGITAGFADYTSVTVDDLGNGDPLIEVSAVCTGADIGTCNGAFAEGDFDRSVSRDFTFDVTFTRTGAGGTTFDTYGLVDGRIVATEVDTFGATSAPIPLPAAAWMLIAALGGLFGVRRFKSA